MRLAIAFGNLGYTTLAPRVTGVHRSHQERNWKSPVV